MTTVTLVFIVSYNNRTATLNMERHTVDDLPDFEQGVLSDLGSKVQVGGSGWGVEYGAGQEAGLGRGAMLLLLILLSNLLVDGATHQVLVTRHLPPWALVHPVQPVIIVPWGKTQSIVYC